MALAKKKKNTLRLPRVFVLLTFIALFYYGVTRISIYGDTILIPGYTQESRKEARGNNDVDYDEHALQLYMHNGRMSLINESTVISIGEDMDHLMNLLENISEIPLTDLENNESLFFDYFTNPNSGDLLLGGHPCHPMKTFRKANGAKKHVLFTHINENWGAFSDHVPNRTVNWGDWKGQWELRGCTMDDLWYYLDHPNVSAVFTTTHQSAIAPHPKVHPLPLGVKYPSHANVRFHEFPSLPNRTKLLVINFSDSMHRPAIEKSVVRNFNGTIKNLYGLDEDGDVAYWQQLREHKFVLCPSGHGWDTYRSWEAIVMGAIPVLETYYKEDGFYRVYDDLPVFWVDHFDNVTAALLEEAYPKILLKAKEYKFEKLTRQWWIDHINSFRS